MPPTPGPPGVGGWRIGVFFPMCEFLMFCLEPLVAMIPTGDATKIIQPLDVALGRLDEWRPDTTSTCIFFVGCTTQWFKKRQLLASHVDWQKQVIEPSQGCLGLQRVEMVG